MRKAIAAVLFGGAALVIAHDWIGIGGPNLDTAINGVAYDAVVVCAGLACLTRALRGGPERGEDEDRQHHHDQQEAGPAAGM